MNRVWQGAVLVMAVVAGVMLAAAPLLGALLILITALGVAWFIAGRRFELMSATLAFAILGLFSGLLNPALVPAEILAYATTLKWIPFLIPIVAALGLSARARQLTLRPDNWAARFFLLFVLWTGIVLVLRVGLDSELLFKWASVLLIYLFAFVAIPALNRGQGELALLRAFAVVSGIVAVTSLAVLVLATGEALSMGRLTGIAFNALTLAMFCTLGVLSFATLGLQRAGLTHSIVCFAAAALCLGLLILTGGRASVIALLLGGGTLVFGIAQQRKARVAFALPVSVLAGVLLLVMAVQLFGVRLDQGLLREEGGESVRLELIRDAAQLLVQDPLTLAVGTGFGVVRKTYYAHLGLGAETDVTTSYSDTFSKLLHNSYLEILVETGVVGFALLLATLFAGIAHMRKVIRSAQGSLRLLGYGCLAIVIAGAVESAFNSVLLAPGGALGIWLWSVIGVYAARPVAATQTVQQEALVLSPAAA